MHRLLGLLSAFLCVAALVAPVGAQQGDVPRVLVVGDSWAEYVWEQRTISWAMDQIGHPDISERGELTAVGGTTAAGWNTPGRLASITSELAAYPTIDVVHLSIGGNDLLGNWNASWTPQQELALLQQVRSDTLAVIAHIQAQRPGIRVVLAGYDYPNFQEMAPLFSLDWFLWLYLGSPTPARIGGALADFEAMRRDLALADPQVDFVHNLGLMQWFYGYPLYGAPRFYAPFPGQAPNYLPFPGGSAAHPSPPSAMRDSFHLDPGGYKVLVGNTTLRVYKPYFDANP